MTQPQLSSFEIIGFNGEQNVKINFYENKKVLIAENGSGKTTILNILYLCLMNKMEKLKEYSFEECILTFQSGQTSSIKAIDLQKINGNTKNFRKRKISNKDGIKIINFINAINVISEYIFENKGRNFFEIFMIEYFVLLNNYQGILPENKILDFLIKHLQDDRVVPIKIFGSLEILSSITKEDLNSIYIFLQEDNYDGDILVGTQAIHYSMVKNLLNEEVQLLVLKNLRRFHQKNNKDDASNKNLIEDIIFLPTYRRIERELDELFLGDTILREDSNVNFGFHDVLSLFKMIQKNIENYRNDNLSELNHKIMYAIIENKKTINSRKVKLGNEESDFYNILKLLGKNTSKNNNKNLLLFLDKFANIYESIEKINKDIDKFIKVCNKYLENKYFVYDESNFEIKVNLKTNNKSINLSSLSLGEKQIVSLFARLYLDHLSNLDLSNSKERKYWIIFDEPELSLSMRWQRMLLEDIWNSGRCGFLFATTHSPFIFDNEFKFYTSHINECLTEL